MPCGLAMSMHPSWSSIFLHSSGMYGLTGLFHQSHDNDISATGMLSFPGTWWVSFWHHMKLYSGTVCNVQNSQFLWVTEILYHSQFWMDACSWPPNTRFWHYTKSKTDGVGLGKYLPRFGFCVLPMWVCDLFLSNSLKCSCDWTILQGIFCKSCMSVMNVACLAGTFHGLVSPTRLGMAYQAWCGCGIKCVEVPLNVTTISTSSFAVSCIAFKGMDSVVANFYDNGVRFEEGINCGGPFLF